MDLTTKWENLYALMINGNDLTTQILFKCGFTKNDLTALTSNGKLIRVQKGLYQITDFTSFEAYKQNMCLDKLVTYKFTSIEFIMNKIRSFLSVKEQEKYLEFIKVFIEIEIEDHMIDESKLFYMIKQILENQFFFNFEHYRSLLNDSIDERDFKKSNKLLRLIELGTNVFVVEEDIPLIDNEDGVRVYWVLNKTDIELLQEGLSKLKVIGESIIFKCCDLSNKEYFINYLSEIIGYNVYFDDDYIIVKMIELKQEEKVVACELGEGGLEKYRDIYLKAKNYLDNENIEEALNLLSTLNRFSYDDLDVQVTLMMCHYRKNQFDEAFKHYLMAKCIAKSNKIKLENTREIEEILEMFEYPSKQKVIGLLN